MADSDASLAEYEDALLLADEAETEATEDRDEALAEATEDTEAALSEAR